jgi:glycosyltransferase involved in cell wall biosynthesis
MLYIDCGHTAQGASYTGIQRYVRHTLRHAQALLGKQQVRALRAGPDGWSCLASLPAHPLEGLPALQLPCNTVEFSAQSHVLLADRFWHTEAWRALDTLTASAARITVVVYDLLSLQQPQWFAPGVGARFRRYLLQVLPRAGQVVCLSSVVAAELRAWMRIESLPPAPIRVVPPGNRVWEGTQQAPVRLPAAWRDGTAPFVLQVGTLEPRKNHTLTLGALQRQWAAGRDVGCLFIGQRGWLMEEFTRVLASLPQWQRQLVWLDECTDAQLAWCYRHAAAVMYPSAGEGYGLPLAEAATAGARVIASDTPVHREVARRLPEGADIQLCAPVPEAMAQALDEVLVQTIRVHRAVEPRTWGQATRGLLDALELSPA